MEIRVRERLLVQKCINSIVHDYREENGLGGVNAEVNLQLSFLSFLTQNKKEEVQYGIEYIANKYKPEYELVKFMVLEYNLNGIEGSLACPSFEEIKEETKNSEETPKNSSVHFKFTPITTDIDDLRKDKLNWWQKIKISITKLLGV